MTDLPPPISNQPNGESESQQAQPVRKEPTPMREFTIAPPGASPKKRGEPFRPRRLSTMRPPRK